MRNVGIYQILNVKTGKFYIGKSVDIDKRWHNHRCYLRKNTSKNPYLQSAWNKYGEQAFEFIIIELCERESLTEREQFWIDCLGACDSELGYNLNPNAGTSQGVKRSQLTKDKISKANKGNKWSEEAKLRITGRKHSKETKAKVAAAKALNSVKTKAAISSSLKGNNRRRDIEKWPHWLGVKCQCDECKMKYRAYHQNRYANKKTILTTEF